MPPSCVLRVLCRRRECSSFTECSRGGAIGCANGFRVRLQHIVFTIKYFFDAIIPDTPRSVNVQMARQVRTAALARVTQHGYAALALRG